MAIILQPIINTIQTCSPEAHESLAYQAYYIKASYFGKRFFFKQAMKKLLINYFSSPLIIGLIILFLFFFYVCIDLGLLKQYFFLIPLPAILAPFYEWITHKYILHAKLSKKSRYLNNFQIRLHHQHHRTPENVRFQFAPWEAVVAHLLQTYLFFALITWSFTIAIMPFTAGVLYYLFYEWIHLAHHTVNYKPLTKLGLRLKRAHMRHHFYNENYCWGITNYFADKCLGTFKDTNDISRSNTTRNIAGYSDNP